MKRLLAAILCIVLCCSCVINAFAMEVENWGGNQTPYLSVRGDNIRVVSIEYIPDAESEGVIPQIVMSAFANTDMEDNGIVPYGTGIPSGSSTHNLSDEGAYHFRVDTTNSVIYSNNVFTGHDGAVTLDITEACGTATSQEFLVKVFVRNWNGTGTTVGQVAIQRNSSGSITVDDLGANDKVYFTVSPQGAGRVFLPKRTDTNYIRKGS